MVIPPDEPETLEVERLQAEYLERLRRLLRRAPSQVREDALREVQSHIDDEWRALGGGLEALRSVLQRLGPPEEYGRDLALQLILLRGTQQPSLGSLVVAGIFWASTSVIGGVVLIGAALIFAFAAGMLFTAIERARGIPVMLIDARHYQVGSFQAESILFPPEPWSPLLIGLVGLLPAVIVFAGLRHFLAMWARSRFALHALALVSMKAAPAGTTPTSEAPAGQSHAGDSPALPPGWERRAVLAMLAFSAFGLGGCLLFSIVSELLPIGHPGVVSLPEDFFRTPLTALAFIFGLMFITSPVLGLLWAVRKDKNLPRINAEKR